MKLAETWSPGWTLFTPWPTSTTTPAPSWPPMRGNGSGRPSCSRRASDGIMSPVTRCSSEWHRPAAPILSRTSPALGGWSSISSTFHSWFRPQSTAARVFIGPLTPPPTRPRSLVDHHTTDVLPGPHVVVALVDGVERVGLGDQAVEVELALTVEPDEL